MQNFEILVLPVISLMGLAFAFSSILRYSQNPKFTSVAFGLLFGSGMVMAMTFPISVGDGFIFDLRSLLLGLCVVFTGWRAGLIALVLAAGYRLYLGGGGMFIGVFALAVAYGVAVLWLRFALPKIKSEPLADIGLGIAMSTTLGATFLMPKDLAMMVLTDLVPIVTFANIIGALGLGFVFRREMKFLRDSEKLRTHAMLDPLTNLLNRRGTEESIRKATHTAGEGRALLCFDLDNFKQINDLHGHEAGDKVLSTVASRIENAIRGETIFSRHGGDEFTIYFPLMDRTSIESVADRLCRTIAKEPVIYRGAHLPITISIGCYWTEHSATYEEMFRIADEQLLISKNNGRNRSTVFLDHSENARAEPQAELIYANEPLA